jgi:hypothetical protein
MTAMFLSRRTESPAQTTGGRSFGLAGTSRSSHRAPTGWASRESRILRPTCIQFNYVDSDCASEPPAITTVGLIAGGFSLLRRRLDPLLLWFAAFAGLYGVHMVLEYQPLWSLGVRAPLSRIGLAIGFLVPVPAFFFFEALDLLGKLGRLLCNVVWPVAVSLALATLVLGYKKVIDERIAFL